MLVQRHIWANLLMYTAPRHGASLRKVVGWLSTALSEGSSSARSDTAWRINSARSDTSSMASMVRGLLGDRSGGIGLEGRQRRAASLEAPRPPCHTAIKSSSRVSPCRAVPTTSGDAIARWADGFLWEEKENMARGWESNPGHPSVMRWCGACLRQSACGWEGWEAWLPTSNRDRWILVSYIISSWF